MEDDSRYDIMPSVREELRLRAKRIAELEQALEYTLCIMEDDGYGEPWVSPGRKALPSLENAKLSHEEGAKEQR